MDRKGGIRTPVALEVGRVLDDLQFSLERNAMDRLSYKDYRAMEDAAWLFALRLAVRRLRWAVDSFAEEMMGELRAHLESRAEEPKPPQSEGGAWSEVKSHLRQFQHHLELYPWGYGGRNLEGTWESGFDLTQEKYP